LDGQREGGTHGVVLHNASTVVDGQRRSQRRLTGVTVYDWTMNARYDGLAEWYDEFNAQGAAGNAPELADLLGPGDGLCLDLGCGTGQYLDVIRSTGRTVVGLDRSADQLRLARRRDPAPPAPGRRPHAPVPRPSVRDRHRALGLHRHPRL